MPLRRALLLLSLFLYAYLPRLFSLRFDYFLYAAADFAITPPPDDTLYDDEFSRYFAIRFSSPFR